jgi:hypothetical protein
MANTLVLQSHVCPMLLRLFGVRAVSNGKRFTRSRSDSPPTSQAGKSCVATALSTCLRSNPRPTLAFASSSGAAREAGSRARAVLVLPGCAQRATREDRLESLSGMFRKRCGRPAARRDSLAPKGINVASVIWRVVDSVWARYIMQTLDEVRHSDVPFSSGAGVGARRPIGGCSDDGRFQFH